MDPLANVTSKSVSVAHAGAEEVSGLRRAVTAREPTATLAGKYRLQSLLGEGGMGVVWRAHNTQLDVPVAIKLLRPGLRTDELAARLRPEGRAAARLVHSNVVRVLDAGETEAGDPFVVMELLQGESLGAALNRGPLQAVEAVRLLLPIADALALAHSRGVVHRDLKPDNIFLALEGGLVQPKLLDFGIAQVAGGATETDPERGATLMGSPQYMSPEQVRGEETDQRTDVWSFCVVLYEALAGRRPFSAGCGCSQLLRSILSDEPLQLEVFAGVDSKLSEVVQRGMAKEREERYSSFHELGQLLAGWLAERGAQEDASCRSLVATWWVHRSNSPPANDCPSANADEQERTLVSLSCPESGMEPRRRPSPIVELAPGRGPMARAAAALLTIAGAGLFWLTLSSSSNGRAASAPTVSKPLRVDDRQPVAPTEPAVVTLASAPAEPDLNAREALVRAFRRAPPKRESVRAEAPKRTSASDLLDPYARPWVQPSASDEPLQPANRRRSGSEEERTLHKLPF